MTFPTVDRRFPENEKPLGISRPAIVTSNRQAQYGIEDSLSRI